MVNAMKKHPHNKDCDEDKPRDEALNPRSTNKRVSVGTTME
jgi:hypothetical protein